MGQVNNNDEFFREYGFDSAGPAPPGSSMNFQNQAQTQSTYSTLQGYSQGTQNSLYPSMPSASDDFTASEPPTKPAPPRTSKVYPSSHGVPLNDFHVPPATSYASETAGFMNYGHNANSSSYTSTYPSAPPIYNPTQWPPNDSLASRNSWNTNEANQLAFGAGVPELQQMVASPMGQFAMEYGRQLVGQTTSDVTQKVIQIMYSRSVKLYELQFYLFFVYRLNDGFLSNI